MPSSRLFAILGVSFSCSLAGAQVEPDTTLLLSFESTLNGAQGETPTSAAGVGYQAGLHGLGGSFPDGSLLAYAAGGNLDARSGTLEFLVRPAWSGDDGLNHTFLAWGAGGGMIFSKDAANNLRAVFNRFAENGRPESGVGISIADWEAGSIHYLAYTWSSPDRRLSLYVDGALSDGAIFSDVPAVAAPDFTVGSDGGVSSLDGALDELRIGNREWTAQEIADRYRALLPVPEPASFAVLGLGALAVLRRWGKARRA